MNPFTKKKWASLEEMRVELAKQQGSYIDNKKNTLTTTEYTFLSSSLFKIVEKVQEAKTSKEFFEATCEVSSLLEKVSLTVLQSIFSGTNLYILLLNAVFRNTKFQEELIEIIEQQRTFTNKRGDSNHLDSKVFLNSGVTLAFFSVAAGISFLKETSIIFIRKNLSDLLIYISHTSSGRVNFVDICFTLESIIQDGRYHYNDKFPIVLDYTKLHSTLRVTRSVSGISFNYLAVNSVLSEKFSIINDKIDANEFNLITALLTIHGVIHKIQESEKSYYEYLPKESTTFLGAFFTVFIRSNERNLLFLLKEMSSGFRIEDKKKFPELILDKINNAEAIRQKLVVFAQENLQAFRVEMGEEKYEWSNKIFIASLRLLSVLSGIKDAKDSRWKVSTAVYEYRQWIDDIHNIINKYSLEDDWGKISNYVDQETSETEWKSTFFTPIGQAFISTEAEIGLGKKLFEATVKAILGMLNTSGGVLLVGLVENPDAIVRDDILKNIIYKNSRAFFDVESELKKIRRTLDSVRVQIFDRLKVVTDETAEKFNDLIDVEPILLKSGNSSATIIKISIKKGDKKFFSVEKKEGGNIVWVSLVMRAQGQTLDVDIRDYIN